MLFSNPEKLQTEASYRFAPNRSASDFLAVFLVASTCTVPFASILNMRDRKQSQIPPTRTQSSLNTSTFNVAAMASG